MKYTQIPALVGAILLTISGIRAQSPDFYFTLDSATAPPNQVVCLHLRAYGFEKIVSLQFAILWDETIVELEHTQNHALPGWSGGDFFTMSNDCLIGGWTEPVGIGYSIPDGDTIVEICFKTLPVPGNGTDVSLGSCFPPGSGGYEAYHAYAQNVWNSNLFVNGRIEVVGNSAVKSLNKTPASILLHPNPTNSSSTLYLETPYSGAGQIQVDNLAGQLTWKQAISLQAGKNIFHIPAEAFPEGGIYLVSVLSAQGRLQRKVIVY